MTLVDTFSVKKAVFIINLKVIVKEIIDDIVMTNIFFLFLLSQRKGISKFFYRYLKKKKKKLEAFRQVIAYMKSIFSFN